MGTPDQPHAWRRVYNGRLKNATTALEKLDKAGIEIGQLGIDVIKHMRFTCYEHHVDLYKVSKSILGISDEATTSDIFAAAITCGVKQSTPETAIGLWLQHADVLADTEMKLFVPILDSQVYGMYFEMSTEADQKVLRVKHTLPSLYWNSDILWAFSS